MSEPIRLDYNRMMAPRLEGRGIEPAWLEAEQPRLLAALDRVDRARESGEIGFFALPYAEEAADRIAELADGLAGLFDDVAVLGIGGSALGTIALKNALLQPFWNELDDEARDYYPRLHVLDNVDPVTFGAFLDRVDVRRTLFVVISKSGSTAETMAQYLVARGRLQALMSDDALRRNLVLVTDPEKGELRRLAREEKLVSLSVPPAVGGRFSVMSAVGLFPAALVGIDVRALLAGARAMDQRCREREPGANPALLFAALQHLAHNRAHAPIHVMMAYADGLYSAADWFRQLWAESLGKRLDRAGREVFRGPTPVKALGATDQHSQVQLYMEGPFDKTVTFLTVGERGLDVEIPGAATSAGEGAGTSTEGSRGGAEDGARAAASGYLAGRSMGELLDAEYAATARALAEHGRMNMTLELPRLDADAMGQFFMMLQVATVLAGELYSVDPLDQPGVELGKRLTYGLMGREGYAPPPPDSPDPRWICR